jgi:hypothetical protein
VTEAGPAGEWEVPDDANGVPDEPTDVEKAQGYVDAWRCVLGHEGVGLGATLFHYGIEGDFGGVWFNVIPGDNKRLGYYAIAEEWQGDPPANTPPRITAMDIPGATEVVAGATLDISLDVSDPDGDALAYFTFFNSKYIDGAGGVAFVAHEQTGPGQLRVTAPQMLGVWKAYVFVEDGHGNVGVETRSFRVVPRSVDGTNVAEGRPAEASSFQTTIDTGYGYSLWEMEVFGTPGDGGGPGDPLPGGGDLGPNVHVFDPSMPTQEIQATLDQVFQQQETAQFGTARHQFLFAPGTYDVHAHIGFNTSINGLGRNPR